MQMFGVRDLRDIKQEMNIAYVSLSIKCPSNQDDDNLSSKAEAFILENPLLTIRGPAGSGKSTLLSWIALQCSEVSKDNNPWNGGIPFLLPLRRLKKEDKGSPNLNLLTEYSTTPNLWPVTPPQGWIHTVLRGKRGVFLIDGIDELPASDRPHFWTWLRGLLHSYPGNRVYITSRFFPESGSDQDLLWYPPGAFVDTQLQELSNSDIAILIKNWHDSVAALMDDEPDEQARLMLAKETLPTKLQDNQNRGVLELCRTPLLCSLVCTLHWKEEGYLPNKRIELYDKCCTMLIEERDKKRDIRPPDGPLRHFDIADKELILQRMAMTMMRNKTNAKTREHNLEISRQEATDWIKLTLPFCDNPEIRSAPPKDVLNYLIERTGLLREPGKDYVDFPHRSFQEYLAACAFGAANEAGDLVNHVSNDQWHETIILSAGTKTGGVPFGNSLIQKLLDTAEAPGCLPHIRQQCFALAVACLETARQVSPHLKERAYAHLSEIVPPKDFTEARNVSAAGESILKYLTYKEWKGEGVEVVASCVHAIRLIGTQKARALLLGKKGYCNDRRALVMCEIIKSSLVKPLEIGRISRYILDADYSPLPNSVKAEIRHLEPINVLTDAERINLDGMINLQSIATLSQLNKLNSISLTDCHSLSDLNTIAEFANLQSLRISDVYYREQNYSFFSDCKHLERAIVLNRFNSNIINDILAAKQLNSLELVYPRDKLNIQLFNSSAVNDLTISFSGAMPNLSQLTKIESFCVEAPGNSTIDGLIPENCRKLSLRFCTSITDIPFTDSVEDLKIAYCTSIKSLSSLKRFKQLKRLEIRDLLVQSFDDIFEIDSLEQLTVKHCTRSAMFPSIKIPDRITKIVFSIQDFDRDFYRQYFKITPIGYKTFALER